MAANSVGDVEFDLLLGTPPTIIESVELVSKTNVDGYFVKLVGKRSDPVTLTGTNYDTSNSNCNAHIAGVLALKGSIVTIDDAHGDDYENQLVENVKLQSKRVVIYNGATAYKTVFDITVRQVDAA